MNDPLIQLELNRAFAMDAAWTEAANALGRLDVPAYEAAMAKFHKIHREPAQPNKLAGRNQ